MSAAREQVLGAIRNALGRGPVSADAAAALDRRMAEPSGGPIPARGRVEADQRLRVFLGEAERVHATTDRVAAWADVPTRVTAYLRAGNRPLVVRAAPDPALAGIPWEREPTLTVTCGAARADDEVSLTGAFAGIAETGSLMLLSGPDSPTTLNFLPTDHIAVVARERILRTYEEAWADLRARFGHGTLPRVVNWITGPSRTADIEQTLLLGAHGPRRLHIVVVDEPGQ